MRKMANAGLIGLLGACLLAFTACGGGDPADRAMDALETAVKQVEYQTGEYSKAAQDPARRDSLKQQRDDLTRAGGAMQLAYTPVRDLDVAGLNMNQEKRRGQLQERAMAAAADLLNITLAPPAKP